MSTDAKEHPFQARLKGKWPDDRLAVILGRRLGRMRAYFPAQFQMDRAHTVMLAEEGVLSAGNAKKILGILATLEDGGFDRLCGGGTQSTLFWYVESALIEALGPEVGGRMHTGRSHNDILPTLSRLTARNGVLRLIDCLTQLREVVIAVAGKHVTTIMPGYTALQHGQPWTMGHYLSGWANALERDFDRLQAAYGRTNQSSLGASALAGSSWPLNRTRTASLLAFDGVLANSRDAGFGNKDYVAEILAAVGILMTNLSTLAADLHLWSTFEFNMIEVADGFCGTSSLMPQKKNAWAVDWIRGAAGNSIGNFASCLGAMRGSSSTDASLQDYPETALPGALGDAIDFLPLLQGVIETMNVNEDLMLERAWSNWTTASNLADAIVRLGGLSFRSAHGIVGRLVRDATASGLGPRGVTPEMLDKAAMEVAGARVGMSRDTIMEALNPLSFIESRVTLGSVNPKEVVLMLKDAGNALREDQDWMLGAQKRIADAETELSVCVNRWMAA